MELHEEVKKGLRIIYIHIIHKKKNVIEGASEFTGKTRNKERREGEEILYLNRLLKAEKG